MPRGLNRLLVVIAPGWLVEMRPKADNVAASERSGFRKNWTTPSGTGP